MTDIESAAFLLPTEYITVEKIEGRSASVGLPDGTVADWSLSTLPQGVCEGDVVAITGEGGDFEVEIVQASRMAE